MPTPVVTEIEMMLACHYLADPINQFGDRWGTLAMQRARLWLKDHGLIDDALKSTERGRVWVDYLCATPLPEQVVTWRLPARAKP